MLSRYSEPRHPIAAALAAIVPGRDGTAGSAGNIQTADYVDLERFSGDWYIIASIPTLIDRHACNATEHYRIDADGTIAATYRFCKGSPAGKTWTIRRTGVVRDNRSNAVWDVRLAGPIAADYRIVHINDDYSQAIVGRNRRDYAWILARTPEISNRQLFEHVHRLREQGYDSSRIRTVPQRWP